MTRILFVTHIPPAPIGSGGEHRSYQIWHDIQRLSDVNEVRIFDPRSDYQKKLKSFQPPRIGPFKLPWRLWTLPHKLRLIKENPYRIFYETTFSLHKFDHSDLVAKYKRTIDEFKPSICIIQHAACSWMAEINNQEGIVMIACPQNLDSIDHAYMPTNRWYLPSTTRDLANEISGLSVCDHILFISKVEVAITTGLGYLSAYYPYLPVGEVKDNLISVRNRRKKSKPEKGLFLVIGTATHAPIYHGIEWLLQQIRDFGLPNGVRLLFAGAGTDKLGEKSNQISGVEFLGWIEQDALEQLLVRVEGILLPKFRGFGSVTRISEMACAGIPLIISRELAFGQSMPPYVWEADKDWQSWVTAINEIMNLSQIDYEMYDNWDIKQERPIEALLHSIDD